MGFRIAHKHNPNFIHQNYQFQSIHSYQTNLSMMDNSMSQKVELFLSCRNLYDSDVFSKSDPYVKVSFKRDFTQKQFYVLGKTETINNNLNPNYQKSFILDFIFESRQDIKFDVFDDDNNGDKDDYLGTVETTIGNLMGSKNQTTILDLKNHTLKDKKMGKIVIRCQKVTQSSQYFMMNLQAQKLYNTDSWFDFWDKSDPYVKFLKIRDDNTFVEVKRTEVVMNNLSPAWNTVEIQQSRLVNPNKGAFKIQVWDWQQSGKDQFIGESTLQLNQIKAGMQIVLSNPKVKKPGNLTLNQFNTIVKPTFVDYLRGGLQLNMMAAVDFTGSNGSPKSPSSLHYMNPVQPNQYQLAIAGITQILLNYDYDKRIPAFGFGGKPKGTSGVSHCFALSGNPQQIEACGVQHFMSMYMRAIENVELSGPTYFGPIIQETMNLAASTKSQNSDAYVVLLIMTDGQIHDMDKTIDLIVAAGQLPLSIIIVGVGNADFSNMDRLDGDNGGLYNSKGTKCLRDIVQFVPFREVQMSPDILARELLAQLPGQVVQYMTAMGKPPGKFEVHNQNNA